MTEPGALHQTAQEGFSSAADVYARGRPDYPPAVDDWLRDVAGIGPGKLVVELGAGTGKSTAHIRALGAGVIAIEPVTEMREQLARAYPEIDARDGTAEAIPVADGAADAVLCAQSFHWFATATALAEIRRVLKPGGVLALVWNVRDESVDWVAELEAIMAPFQGDTPQYTTGLWRNAFPADGFGPLEAAQFANGHEGPPERVIVDRTLSTSFIAALPEAARDRFASRVRVLIAETPELRGKNRVTFPYQVHVYATRKL
ncbi:class I SAM-dependent methyltransferase [Sphingomonas quercus]|uniref:Methyltransferase domain-containing protein n=1 Tax=Sphingomonas quercus TaxID=2842451 RepID=A0ABS6BLW6_9SPHN|nr:class I SAM-dependent methyltransferase [Sphingomonas quercus]MBU3079318.1 methyltransferase domain-containing protein [Sphingomonas quercus]